MIYYNKDLTVKSKVLAKMTPLAPYIHSQIIMCRNHVRLYIYTYIIAMYITGWTNHEPIIS